MDMIVHCQRLNGTCAQPPALHVHTASSRPEARHVVQMACGQPMCLQHDSCSWRAMFGHILAASSHRRAALVLPTCSRPRSHAPQAVQIEPRDTYVCRSTEASAHHWLAHDDARHVAEVGDTPNDMIVQWLELNRACAQPPALHAHTVALEG